ncbi:hypothetical protein CYMTET_14845 [Cymbomonas tetramitiformis]|uniref:Uncharacterized protein n=1 Tax=Cymbomonas tetramitiformis TaxID=36881 RepID=A0AAE0L9L8_9CHLO|nr:hypothetical protein CYMTET_14845 [Cymbomonas tetramitiformis]
MHFCEGESRPTTLAEGSSSGSKNTFTLQMQALEAKQLHQFEHSLSGGGRQRLLRGAMRHGVGLRVAKEYFFFFLN